MTTPSFISFCGECFEMVRYVHGRPQTHDCTTNNNESENDDV